MQDSVEGRGLHPSLQASDSGDSTRPARAIRAVRALNNWTLIWILIYVYICVSFYREPVANGFGS